MNTSTEMKDRYRIPDAWKDLGLAGQPGKTCRSPFPGDHQNGDANPSFSVFDDGRRWKDFATGETGDVFDLVRKAHGSNPSEAFRFVRDRLGVATDRTQPCPTSTVSASRKPSIPKLRVGKPEEFRQITHLRGFSNEALRLAEARGLLRFTQHFGHGAWCIAESRNELIELRRLDGLPWEAMGRLHVRKSHCLGSGKRWPIGTLESVPFPKVAFVEGAPDLLAAFHFLIAEGKESSVAPVAALGASNHVLDPEALRYFSGKVVRIFPHLDKAGYAACRAWARSLKGAGAARVEGFNLSGLERTDRVSGKDLADLVLIHADCFEKNRKFWEVMP